MKKTALLFGAIILVITLNAQYNPWSDAVALTDSLSFNSNPTVAGLAGGTYMFYEKKTDESSPSMICYRDIENMADEQILFSNSNFIYRNPVYCNTFTDQYFLLYESNEAGNFNIYAVEIFPDGTFGSSLQLTATGEDESSVYYYSNSYNVCWEAAGNIYISKLVIQPDTLFLDKITLIDTNNCFNPVCGSQTIGYMKVENDSMHIYASEFDSLPFYWSSPFPVDTTANCRSLTLLSDEFYQYPAYFMWEKNGKVYVYNNGPEQVEIPGGEQFSSIHEPSGFEYSPPVKDVMSAFISFVADNDGNSDVYTFYNLEMNAPYNLSNNNNLNSKPEFFIGWGTGEPCEIYLLDIWENHSQSNGVSLCMSKTGIYVCGGIEENNNNPGLLRFSPNPFSGNVTIEFYQTNSKPVEIKIYSESGIAVKTFEIGTPVYGWNTVRWMPEKLLAKGLYNVVFKQDKNISSSKIIKY